MNLPLQNENQQYIANYSLSIIIIISIISHQQRLFCLMFNLILPKFLSKFRSALQGVQATVNIFLHWLSSSDIRPIAYIVVSIFLLRCDSVIIERQK